MLIVLGLATFVLLLLVSGFFSAAETALIALSPQRAKRIAFKKPELAQALLGWLEKPHELLVVILAGNTIVNVLIAAITTALSFKLFQQTHTILLESASWVVSTMAIVILAEMAPKFMARANPEKTSLWVLPWLARIRKLFFPILFLVSRTMNNILPRWKARPVGPMLTFSLDELKALLNEGQAETSVPSESVGMMARALEIHDRTAEKIMTPLGRVDVVEMDPPGRPPRSKELLLDLIIEEGHTRTPLKQGGEIIGFVHSDDLLPLILREETLDLRRLVRRAMDVPANRRVIDLLQDFRGSGIHCGFVRDAQGVIIGFVTLEDVLEEITGDILDEYDVENPAQKDASPQEPQ